MLETAESLLDTFAIMVDKYGFIPNGLRQYYLDRSQPPFYFLMVKKLAEAYGKKGLPERVIQLEKKHLPTLLKEHTYWEETHSLTVSFGDSNIKVNQYRAKT
jgi:alpha,alpha-trehalase